MKPAVPQSTQPTGSFSFLFQADFSLPQSLAYIHIPAGYDITLTLERSVPALERQKQNKIRFTNAPSIELMIVWSRKTLT
jgi:hypothetical protein